MAEKSETVKDMEGVAKSRTAKSVSENDYTLMKSISPEEDCDRLNRIAFEERIVVHRMPYMRMPAKVIHKANLILFVAMCLLAIDFRTARTTCLIVTAFNAGFSIIVYPAILYYQASKQRLIQMESRLQQ